MKRSEKPKPVSLTLAHQEKFKEQILIVLADYQTCKDPYGFGTNNEGIRNEVAGRIMNNLRVVATMKLADL